MRQILSTCSDDSKPYKILKDLVESFPNHIGFAIIRARGKDLCHAKVGSFLRSGSFVCVCEHISRLRARSIIKPILAVKLSSRPFRIILIRLPIKETRGPT